MKHKILFGALCATATFLSSCSEEDIVKMPHAIGDEIVFGARAGFENADNSSSRTVYSGVTYTASGKTFERIDWVQNIDKIQIYCPQADAAQKTVDYVVTGSVTSDTEKSYSTLTKSATEVRGLQWGSDDVHTFYAMYPSSEMLPPAEQTTLKKYIKMDGTVVNGYIPISQAGTIEATANGYVVKPNMTYAYMVAKNSVYPTSGDAVNLTFYPLVTAMEMTLTLKDNATTPSVSLEEILITSVKKDAGTGKYITNTDAPITGGFACDLASWTPGSTYPAITTPSGESTDYTINVPLWIGASPMVLEKGKSVTFTVFLRPGNNIENLQVALQTATGITSKVLDNISITSNTKHVVNGLTLPTVEFNYSKWMSYLPDNMKLKDLSLPGTGATFSNNYTGSNPELYKGQNISFEEQWNAGIRAFEIISEREQNADDDLFSTNVDCNGESTGVTVGDVFVSLLDKLAATNTETAVLMMTYQPVQNKRDPSIYMNNLKNLYDLFASIPEYNDRFIEYNPNLKLKDVRGKLMIITRPTQHVEDKPHNFDGLLSGTRIINIDGCGTAKDKWGCRGYKVKVGPNEEHWQTALDIQPGGGQDKYDANDKYNKDAYEDYYDYPIVENYILATYDEPNNNRDAWLEIDALYHGRVKKEKMNFEYESNLAGVKIWCQEWQRVVPALHDFKSDGQKDGVAAYLGNCVRILGSNTTKHHFYAFWHESYNEKLKNITETFDMAISGNYENTYLFINSLCGYYVTDPTDATKNTSYVPYSDDPCKTAGHYWRKGNHNLPTENSWPVGGMDGDIAGLAKDLNNEFYQYILSKSEADFTGPTGLVYMNRVAKELTVGDEGSYYLPGVIIANNFKHDN